jgi:hypothetical protein|tara:strand:+ start:260 stop:517 length:258 start_codon:yes stop_codon:yes gene_type:complete
MRSTRTTVGTTATLLIDSDTTHRTAVVHAISNTTVYLGASDVTSSTGFIFEKDDGAISLTIPAGEKLYAVVATGTEVVTCLLPDA